MSDTDSTTSALIPLHNHIFDQRTKPGVSARALYQFLEFNQAGWARWVKKNLTANPYAIEHIDWEDLQPEVVNSNEAPTRGRPSKDYILSIDFSKRLAMMARSAKGEEARAYFLDCERRAQSPSVPELHDPAYQLLVRTVIDLDATRHQLALLEERERVRDQELIATQQKVIEGFVLAEQANAKAEHAEAHAQLIDDDRSYFTVAEYVQYEDLEQKIPMREYKAVSDHLMAYCVSKGLPYRRIPVGGKSWSEEYGYHRRVYEAALTGWLRRRYSQGNLTTLYPEGS